MFFLTHLLTKPDTEHTGQVSALRPNVRPTTVVLFYAGELRVGNVSKPVLGLLSRWRLLPTAVRARRQRTDADRWLKCSSDFCFSPAVISDPCPRLMCVFLFVRMNMMSIGINAEVRCAFVADEAASSLPYATGEPGSERVGRAFPPLRAATEN